MCIFLGQLSWFDDDTGSGDAELKVDSEASGTSKLVKGKPLITDDLLAEIYPVRGDFPKDEFNNQVYIYHHVLYSCTLCLKYQLRNA